MAETTDPNLEPAFAFLHVNEREAKPRNRGLTEIRGPYYSPLGKRYLEDILETMSVYVDSLKFAGGAFSLMPRKAVKELIDLCHAYQVLVSTGGFIEHVLTQGYKAVHRYLHECRELGFDIVEVSSGFIAIPTDDLVRLVEEVQQARHEGKAGSGHPVWRWRRDDSCRTRGRRDARPGDSDRAGPPISGCGCVHYYDRIGRDNGKRHDLAHRHRGPDCQCSWARPRHVRGRRSGGIRLVHQELRPGGQSLRRP